MTRREERRERQGETHEKVPSLGERKGKGKEREREKPLRRKRPDILGQERFDLFY